MPSRNTKFYSLILIIIDTFVLLAAFTLAYILRVRYDPRPLVANVHAYDYLYAFLLIIPFWILIFVALGLYQRNTYNRRLVEWSKILIGSVYRHPAGDRLAVRQRQEHPAGSLGGGLRLGWLVPANRGGA